MPKIKLHADEVFTPRSHVVNDDMYIPRPKQEGSILRNIGIDKHLIIHGESGTGKSWLYKKVFDHFGIHYVTVNMANAARFKSLDKAFDAKFKSLKKEIKRGVKLEGSAGANIGFFRGGIKEIEEIELLTKEPFEQLLELCTQSDGKQAFIVFENMESILDDQILIDQVSNVITLVDDEDYARMNVKILIVGVPNDIQSYFSQAKNYNTIANRIVEIPEVDRLPRKDSERFLHKGLCELLGFHLIGITTGEIADFCDDIPQYLHELGLALAYTLASKTEKKTTLTHDDLKESLSHWMSSSFTSDHTAIIGKMNSNNTKVGRRNQVIYCMALYEGKDFKYNDIEGTLRKEFPESTKHKNLNISQILHELAEEPNPIIRKTPKGDAYRFMSPKTKICIRCSLFKTDSEQVQRVDAILEKIRKA